MYYLKNTIKKCCFCEVRRAHRKLFLGRLVGTPCTFHNWADDFVITLSSGANHAFMFLPSGVTIDWTLTGLRCRVGNGILWHDWLKSEWHDQVS